MDDLATELEPKQYGPRVPRTWVRPYYASFNGLRGIAVGLTFLCRFGGSLESTTSQTLWVGVDLFFVLSGFLITGILYDSLDDPHYFRNFYVRRALRIFPIFYGFFLVLAILTPILHLHVERGMLAFVFYFGNLTVPFTDLVKHNPTAISVAYHGKLFEIGNIGNLWSLCVEEQFYLVWPTVVWWVRDRRWLMGACALVTVLTIMLRFILLTNATAEELSYYLIHWSTYTRCDSLLIGAWLALFLRGRELSAIQLRRMSYVLFWTSAAGLVFGVPRWHRDVILQNPFLMTVGYTLIGLAAAGVLLRALDDDSLVARVLRWGPLSGLGAISYGFYFYHSIPSHPLHVLIKQHSGLTNVVPLVWFAVPAGIAWLSFRFYETPFLRLKKVLAPQTKSVREAA